MTSSPTESPSTALETSGSIGSEVSYRTAPTVPSTVIGTGTILGHSCGMYVATKMNGQYVSSEIDVAKMCERKVKNEIRRSL